MKLGFIGTGNMAGAIMGGIIRNEIFKPEEIIGADISKESRSKVQSAYGINVTEDNKKAASESEVLVLSVKPQYYAETIKEIKDCVREDQLIITIAPGKTLKWLEEQFEKKVKIVRAMPNTPALVGEGMTAGDRRRKRICVENLTFFRKSRDCGGKYDRCCRCRKRKRSCICIYVY